MVGWPDTSSIIFLMSSIISFVTPNVNAININNFFSAYLNVTHLVIMLDQISFLDQGSFTLHTGTPLILAGPSVTSTNPNAPQNI